MGKNEIYLKGAEGERLLSLDDVACAQFAEPREANQVSFRLKPEAANRAKNFAENNRGIKANLLLCGKPLAFHVGRRFEDLGGVITEPVPESARSCVRKATKRLRSCEKIK